MDIGDLQEEKKCLYVQNETAKRKKNKKTKDEAKGLKEVRCRGNNTGV